MFPGLKINVLGHFQWPLPPWMLRLSYRWPIGSETLNSFGQDIAVGIRDGEKASEDSPLLVCKGCGKLVPRTNLCLYCGSPILFKKSAS